MIFYIKILLTTLNPFWILEKQSGNYFKHRSEVKIIRIESEIGETVGYRKTISHGGYVRDWVKEVNNNASA